MLSQDLHIHTTFSVNDTAVVAQQTIEFIAALNHAEVIGISDHFDDLIGGAFASYTEAVRDAGFKLGVEVDGHKWSDQAAGYPVDYYLFHCRDKISDYLAVEKLLATGKPVILAHPNIFYTDLNRIAQECIIEINNRYVWRTDWKKYYQPFTDRFRFVFGSDAHQPNWLGQSAARYVGQALGIREYMIF